VAASAAVLCFGPLAARRRSRLREPQRRRRAKAEAVEGRLIYVGPGRDAGWSYAHDLGRKAVEAEFGDKVKTSFVEKVPEGADAERVIRDLATQGTRSTSPRRSLHGGDVQGRGAFPTCASAATATDVRTCALRLSSTSPQSWQRDRRKMTNTNTLGFVGSFPIPEVLRNINAFTLGAQSVNPKSDQGVWVSTGSIRRRKATPRNRAQMAALNVLLPNTDSTAVLQTAEKNGKYAFGGTAT